jgi:hypothetical protein
MGAFSNGPGATAALAAVSAGVVGINLAGVWAFAGEHLAAASAAVRGGAGLAVCVYLGFLGLIAHAVLCGPANGGGGEGADGGGGGGGADAPLLGGAAADADADAGGARGPRAEPTAHGAAGASNGEVSAAPDGAV